MNYLYDADGNKIMSRKSLFLLIDAAEKKENKARWNLKSWKIFDDQGVCRATSENRQARMRQKTGSGTLPRIELRSLKS